MRMRRIRTLLLFALAAALLPACADSQPPGQDFLWWEAENPQATNFPPRHSFEPANAKEADALSEGKWIGADGEQGKTLFLEYTVNAPKDGDYNFYARKFWKHGPFRWRFNAQPWRTCGADVALMDSVELRQFLVANWVGLGKVALKAGPNRLRIEQLEPRGAAAYDCFALTRGPFVANGKRKPGEKFNRAPEGWFPFEPDMDTFQPSPIDLRFLNEKAAGENGYIRVKGDDFVHEKTGKPARFWAVNMGGDNIRMDKASVDYMARFLAKRGVNMARVHGSFWKENLAPDTEQIDRLFYFVAAMKREGIYTSLSIYFPLWLNLKPEHGFEGYNGKIPFALLFFNPKFQDIYRNWWRALLATPNPYTKTPLAQEPAVAIAELVNEDSFLFWTFTPYENIPGPQMTLLEKQFGGWLTKKYGSMEQAFRRWGGGAIRGDDAGAGRAGFMPLWEIFNKKDARAQDTAAFLTLKQKAFFEENEAFLKRDLGYKGLVYASNWITADRAILGPLDKYSNAGADLMDRHGYFGGPHQGERASYSLNVGDRYDDRSALLFEPEDKSKSREHSFDLPIIDIAYNGLPSIITEINWPMPNRYRADLPLLAAAYGSLQGSDGFYFFAADGMGWQQTHTKFGIQSPVVMGQFPAIALLYRKRLVQRSEPVARAELKLSDLFALKGAPVSGPQNLDELRAKDIPAGRAAPISSLSTLDPLAFLAGRVEINMTAQGGQSQAMDLSKFIDRSAKTVRSVTGELFWNYATGLVTVNAPQAQGATGFLRKAGMIALGDIAIAAPLDYGAILLVALDDQPLKTSKKMLLQVMTEDKNFGWSAPGEGLRPIVTLGGPPIVVKNLQGAITLKRPDAESLKVTPLDFNGYKTRASSSGTAIALQPNTLYYLIEK